MLIEKKLLLFGGKGGVGKTSMAAATAFYAASQGKKTLVLSTDPAHSLGDSFEKEIGNKITKINDNLDALEIDAAALMEEYKEKNGIFIKQIADEGTFFSKEEIQQFFDLSLPGMDELMALVKIIDILEENAYDILILDTAPTGHTIRLLEMPVIMEAYVKVLAEMRQKHRVVVSMMMGKYVKDAADTFIEKLHADLQRIKLTLQNKQKTAFIPVTIPEAMSVAETSKLIGVLKKYAIPIGSVILNQVMQDNCDFCKAKKIGQEKYINEIKKTYTSYTIKEIPLFPQEIKGKSLELLAKILSDQPYTLPKPLSVKGEAVTSDALQLKPNLTFLMFGGKGGVGKTSMAAAAALHFAKNKKVLLFSTDPAHSLGDSFEKEIGNKITPLTKNLDALEIDAYALLNKLKATYKKEINDFFKTIFQPTSGGNFRGTIDAPYDRKVIVDLFDLAPPGIDEIMALKTLMDMMKEKTYDLYILDTAPSGHTLRLLALPEIAEQWVQTLSEILEHYPISFSINDTLQELLVTIKDIRKMFADTSQTEFVSVAIPEDMSLLETKDLLAGLHTFKVPSSSLIINKLIPQSSCSFCSAKRAEQLSYVKQLKELKLKTTIVELCDTEIKGAMLPKLEETLFTPKSNKGGKP